MPLRVLRDEGHISREAFKLLSDKTSERFSKVMDMNKQMEDLRSLGNKNFESVKEEINKKYSEM